MMIKRGRMLVRARNVEVNTGGIGRVFSGVNGYPVVTGVTIQGRIAGTEDDDKPERVCVTLERGDMLQPLIDALIAMRDGKGPGQ